MESCTLVSPTPTQSEALIDNGGSVKVLEKGIGWDAIRGLNSIATSFANPFASVSDKSHETEAFRSKLDELYPGSWNHEEAAVAIKHILAPHGFNEANTIALVAQCRDEIAKPFVTAIDHNWNGSFNISSLAGTVICGKVGFTAAIHHAPQDEKGIERYVVFVGPHIAIDADGNVGNVVRRGRKAVSSACGALIAFCGELTSGTVDVEDKPLDVEYCALKRRLLRNLPYGKPPTLTELTRACQVASVEDVRAILDQIVTKGACEYAVVSGTLVHGPEFSHYFAPASVEVFTSDGKQEDITNALGTADREHYRREMLHYLAARAQYANLICSECSEPLVKDVKRTDERDVCPPPKGKVAQNSGSSFCSIQ